MIKKSLNILCFIIMVLPTYSQTGGDNVYEFLNLTHSGLVASLGGTNVSLGAGDLNMAYHNPALLGPEMNESLAMNYVNYFAGINYGMAMYSESFDIGSFAAGITYLNYGTFTETDASGVITGTFKASEYAFSLIYSRQIDSSFSLGINLKPVLSYLERYSSAGFAIDFGANWHNKSNLFSAGIAVKNLGFQITTYTGEPREKLPFEIQAGLSQRLAYAPFRFSLTLRHLEKYDLTHQYLPYGTSGTEDNQNSEFFENMMRHVIIGAELIPHKNFYFCGGYNYQRRKELQVESKVSTVGFSWGFGIKTSLLDVEFGRATYHLAGTSTHISLILKTGNIYKKIRN
jgi:hypothetical protein